MKKILTFVLVISFIACGNGGLSGNGQASQNLSQMKKTLDTKKWDGKGGEYSGTFEVTVKEGIPNCRGRDKVLIRKFLEAWKEGASMDAKCEQKDTEFNCGIENLGDGIPGKISSTGDFVLHDQLKTKEAAGELGLQGKFESKDLWKATVTGYARGLGNACVFPAVKVEAKRQ